MKRGLVLSRCDAFSTVSPFNDAMLLHGKWRAVLPGTQSPHPDPLVFSGEWPVPKSGQWALCRVFAACEGRHPMAEADGFLVEWQGDGDVSTESPYDDLAWPTNDVALWERVSRETKGIPILITRSNQADPVRDIRLWLPGCRRSERFNRQFVDALRAFLKT